MPKLARRKDRPNYYAWLTDPATNKKVRRSTGQSNQRTAGVVAERRERSAFSSHTPTRLTQAIDTFLTQRAALKSAATQEFYRKKLGIVLDRLGNVDLAAITADALDSYCAQRLAEKVTRNTVGKERTALRGVLKLARRQKKYPWALDEVFDSWEPGYEPRERWVTDGEAWAIIRALPPHRGAVVAFILATGARLGEAMRAQREDVSSDKSQVALRGTKTVRAKRPAPVLTWGAPFLEYALTWSGRSARGIPMFLPWEKAMRWDLKRVCEKLQIPGVSANDLRRTYAQWLRQKGVDPVLIGVTLGHADSRMVERVYGRVPAEKLRGLLDQQIKS